MFHIYSNILFAPSPFTCPPYPNLWGSHCLLRVLSNRCVFASKKKTEILIIFHKSSYDVLIIISELFRRYTF